MNDGSLYEKIIVHDTKCLVDENNELWRKAGYKTKVNREVLRKYFGKGIKSIDRRNYNAFAKEVFEITFDLVLDDIIDRNYQFAMPNIVGGRLMACTSRYYLNGKFNRVFSSPNTKYHLYLVDFMKYARSKVIVTIRFNNDRLMRRFRKKIKGGHTYPAVDPFSILIKPKTHV